mmetsp:Transcript_86928/g.246465  ORF Transcript_86928/g.246465 Transcript_86928/m.246465 type:complete len:342 (-) Transcript_86928:625-1650(-)
MRPEVVLRRPQAQREGEQGTPANVIVVLGYVVAAGPVVCHAVEPDAGHEVARQRHARLHREAALQGRRVDRLQPPVRRAELLAEQGRGEKVVVEEVVLEGTHAIADAVVKEHPVELQRIIGVGLRKLRGAAGARDKAELARVRVLCAEEGHIQQPGRLQGRAQRRKVAPEGGACERPVAHAVDVHGAMARIPPVVQLPGAHRTEEILLPEPLRHLQHRCLIAGAPAAARIAPRVSVVVGAVVREIRQVARDHVLARSPPGPVSAAQESSPGVQRGRDATTCDEQGPVHKARRQRLNLARDARLPCVSRGAMAARVHGALKVVHGRDDQCAVVLVKQCYRPI